MDTLEEEKHPANKAGIPKKRNKPLIWLFKLFFKNRIFIDESHG
jgi:hypothetical protein